MQILKINCEKRFWKKGFSLFQKRVLAFSKNKMKLALSQSSTSNPIQFWPLYTDPNFYQKLYQKQELYQHRYKPSDQTTPGLRETGDYGFLPHQCLISTLIGPHTPYRSLEIYHGTGAGKSWVVIRMVEKNRIFFDEHNTSAFILVPNNMIKLSWIDELLGIQYHGTEKHYVKKCTGDAYLTEAQRDILNDKKVDSREKKRILNFVLKYRVGRYYEFSTHKKWYTQVKNMSDEEIKKVYSNRMICVDEIQGIRNKKQLYDALRRVVKCATNMILIFMSATPMIDAAVEICPSINLLRLNDGVEEMEVNLIKEYCDYDTQEITRPKLLKIFKGYISFLRGMNPVTFPKRTEMGESVTDLFKFPIIECEMKGIQLNEYLKTFMDQFSPNADAGMTNDLWDRTREMARCLEPKRRVDWIVENIEPYACKFKKIWDLSRDAIQKRKGPILVYAFNVERGIHLFERFLKENGIKEYDPLKSDQKETYVNFSRRMNKTRIQAAKAICKSHDN